MLTLKISSEAKNVLVFQFMIVYLFVPLLIRVVTFMDLNMIRNLHTTVKIKYSREVLSCWYLRFKISQITHRIMTFILAWFLKHVRNSYPIHRGREFNRFTRFRTSFLSSDDLISTHQSTVLIFLIFLKFCTHLIFVLEEYLRV